MYPITEHVSKSVIDEGLAKFTGLYAYMTDMYVISGCIIVTLIIMMVDYIIPLKVVQLLMGYNQDIIQTSPDPPANINPFFTLSLTMYHLT